jgi:release factor glutamine methyltransferase
MRASPERLPLQMLLRDASTRLSAAGVETALVDARLLLAHVLGLAPSQLLLVDEVDHESATAFAALIARREVRVPVQHLTGHAYFRDLDLEVGPGVFVPRPETEVMTGWAIERLRSRTAIAGQPLVVDLCSGSGAIAKAIATEVPGAVVHAVEVSPSAAQWAARNLSGTQVNLHVDDMAGALAELDGTVDLVIANPPYIPLEAFESVAPEAREHDPAVALFSGPDGLAAVRVVVAEAARLLRDGAWLCFEHADVQGASAPAAVVESELFGQVRDHHDLARRPRFVTAVRRPRIADVTRSP